MPKPAPKPKPVKPPKSGRPQTLPYRLNQLSPQFEGLRVCWPVGPFDLTQAAFYPTTLSILAEHTPFVYNGGALLVSDPTVGWCIQHDGTNDYSVSSDCDLDGITNYLTYGGWFYWTSWAATGYALSLSSAWFNNDGCFTLNRNGATQLYCGVRGGGVRDSAEYTVPAVGEWMHVLCTIDFTLAGGAQINLYLNGVLQTAAARPETNDIASGTAFADSDLWLASRGNIDSYSALRCSDIRIYQKVLSAAEVWRIYDPQTRWDLYQRTDEIWVGPGAAAPGVNRLGRGLVAPLPPWPDHPSWMGF